MVLSQLSQICIDYHFLLVTCQKANPKLAHKKQFGEELILH